MNLFSYKCTCQPLFSVMNKEIIISQFGAQLKMALYLQNVTCN